MKNDTKYRFKCLSLIIVLIVCTLSGCATAGSGREQAYAIQNQLYEELVNYYNEKGAQTTSDTGKNQTNQSTDMKHEVNAKDAQIVGTKDAITFNGFSLQVEQIQMVDTIYKLNNLMEQKDADEYCERLTNEYPNHFQQDGSLSKGDKTQLLFIKCKIKNNNSTEKTIYMKPIFYGVDDSKTWGSVGALTYDYSGKHELYHSPISGLDQKGYYTFTPSEELETVFVIGMPKIGNPDMLAYGCQNENMKVYMYSSFLDGKSSGTSSILKTGTYLIPVLSNNEIMQ